MNEKPKVGERWKVTETFEGTVASFRLGGIEFEEAPGRYWTDAPAALNPTRTMERVPDPEPEWKPGDLVEDARGVVYRRWYPSDGYVWGLPGENHPHRAEDYPARPLRRLVIEGEQ